MSTGGMKVDPINEEQMKEIWIILVKIGFAVFAILFPFLLIFIINIITGVV